MARFDTGASFGQFGRFSEPALYILVSLAAGPKHGYAMVEDVQRLFGVHLGPGTLYGALARLEQWELIEALPEVGRRRPYRITPQGIAVLRTQLQGLQQVARAGLERLEALS